MINFVAVFSFVALNVFSCSFFLDLPGVGETKKRTAKHVFARSTFGFG